MFIASCLCVSKSHPHLTMGALLKKASRSAAHRVLASGSAFPSGGGPRRQIRHQFTRFGCRGAGAWPCLSDWRLGRWAAPARQQLLVASFLPRTGSAPTAFVSARATVPQIQQGNDNRGNPAIIVGMWHVIYTATYSTAGPIPVPVIPPGPPDSFEFAETMKTWHADGTEWEEKIAPAPVGFCSGVWTTRPWAASSCTILVR